MASTSDIKVVDSKPRHVFDRAAMDAVERYEFKPAMKNGVAVSSEQAAADRVQALNHPPLDSE